MAIYWTDIENGEQLLSVRNKINNFNDSVVNETTDLNQRVNTLESNTSYYKYNVVNNILNIPETYQEIVRLTVARVPKGVYEFKFGFSYRFESTNKSVYYRVSFDGGSTWKEYSKEPKDTTDTELVYFGFPTYLAAEQDIDMIFEVKKEAGGNNLDISYAHLIIDRK